MNAAQMTTDEVARLLPYGPNFLFVDEVVVMPDERRIVTRKTYASDHPVVGAHRPGGLALVPGAVLIEQAAQSALLLGLESGWIGRGQRVLLARVKAEFLVPVLCPVIVEADIALSICRPETLGFAASLNVGGVVHARVAGVCALPDEAQVAS